MQFSQAVFIAQQRYLSALLSNPTSYDLQFQAPNAAAALLSPQLRSQLDIARRENEQISARFRQIELRENSLRKTLVLNQRIADDLEPLFREGGMARVNYLSQLNKVQESQAELASLGEEREKLLGVVAAQLTQPIVSFRQ